MCRSSAPPEAAPWWPRRVASRVLAVLCLKGNECHDTRGAKREAMTGIDHFRFLGRCLRSAAASTARAGFRPTPPCRANSERSAA
jgi:hypothetical protein